MQELAFDGFSVRVLSAGQWNTENDNIDIEVSLPDGRRFAATLFTLQNLSALLDKYKASGECANGTFVWAVEMIVLRDLTCSSIEATIQDLVFTGQIGSAMLPID